jgi:hypothetical protein
MVNKQGGEGCEFCRLLIVGRGLVINGCFFLESLGRSGLRMNRDDDVPCPFYMFN